MGKKPTQFLPKEGFTTTARRLDPPLYPRGDEKGYSRGLADERCSWCGQPLFGYAYGPVRLDERSKMPLYYYSNGGRCYFHRDDSTNYCTFCVHKMVLDYQEGLRRKEAEETERKKRQLFYERVFKGVE